MTEQDTKKLVEIDEMLSSISNQLESCVESTESFEDTYEQYVAVSKIYLAMHQFADRYLKKSDELMKYILDNRDDVSDTYELIFPANTKRSVNMTKLRENRELFDKCAFVKDTFITKALGRQRLRDMFCEEYGGEDKAFAFMTANITDLEKAVGKSEAAKYTIVDSRRTETPMIVEKDSYPADYYKLGEDEVTRVFTQNLEVKAPKAFSKVKVEL